MANLAMSQTTDFIRFDSATTHTNYSMVWKTALLNQVVAVFDGRNQPLMLLMLPANGSKSPVPGVYNFVEGKKRTVKKGSQTAKLEYEPGYISADGMPRLPLQKTMAFFGFQPKMYPLFTKKAANFIKSALKWACL